MASNENVIAKPADNTIASDAISAKLIEVSHVAESLDAVLHDCQSELSLLESSSSSSSSSTVVDRKISSANTSDDWNSSLKSSTEDESFVTASEYTPSRSSSYHTASECRGNSPWTWNESADRSSIDLDSSDPEQSSSKRMPDMSSANVSFDESEHSFRSPVSFSEQIDRDSPPMLPPKISSPLVEYPEPVPHHENKIYTIFESPTSSPSVIDEEGGSDVLTDKKVSDDNNNITELTGLSYYYQNIITKQVLKTCL